MAGESRLSASKRTIVVVGATSEAGRVAARQLTQQGHVVRGVARSLGISLTDAQAVDRAFQGADSAYLMIPFDMGAEDLHQFERQIAARLVEAISRSGISRVVLLSGLNAHLKMGTSLGAAEMEERLD